VKLIAFVLLALGVASLIFGGIGYDRQKTLFKIGDMEATATEHRSFPIAPAVGVIALLAGTALLVIDRRNSGRRA
jgi:hypothetical protein